MCSFIKSTSLIPDATANLRNEIMYYCFIDEDIEGLVDDPLIIQMRYAQRLGVMVRCSLKQQAIINPPSDIANHQVLLRCTYDNLSSGLSLLKSHGFSLVEKESDIEFIEKWHTLNISKRLVCETTISALLSHEASADIFAFLEGVEKFFLKSKHKGFSAVISTQRLLQDDSELMIFLEAQGRKHGREVLLSQYYSIKKDSLGSRESRHIILYNQVVNSSRSLFGIKHTVPKSHITKAYEVANQIKEIENFPSNYVLDLGEFIIHNDDICLDVVELNPLSCSMCYVNNSVFEESVPEIEEHRKKLIMGFEYCYDAITNPKSYTTTRVSNKDFSYSSEERYVFL